MKNLSRTGLVMVLFLISCALVIAPADAEPFFGFVPVIGESVDVEGYKHDDRGVHPKVLAELYKNSRANCMYVGGGGWNTVCPADPGDEIPEWNFRLLDAFTDPFLVEGRLAIAGIGIAPPRWLPDGVENPRYWSLADTYLRAIIEKFNEKGVTHFIFDNEPNMLSRRDWAEYHMDQLKFAYPIIKSVNPKNVVIAGNLAENAAHHWEQLYELGLKDYSDVLGYHPYSDSPMSGINIDDVIEVRKVMAKYGDEKKKMFFGEGWGPKRELPGLKRDSADTPPSEAEIMMLRQFMVNGYRNIVTPRPGYDPDLVLGAFFFTLNDNTGGEHWDERAVAVRNEQGEIDHYTVDGYWVGKELPSPAFFNGGLVQMNGKQKARLLDCFPSGSLLGMTTLTITADDEYTAYINGEKIGAYRGWEANEVYCLDLPPGRHVLAIKAEKDPGTPGSVIVDLRRDELTIVSGEEGWKGSTSEVPGWTDPDFDDSDWRDVPAGGLGFHAPPWTYGYMGFVDSDAKWIWLYDDGQMADAVYLRLEFVLE